MSWILILDKAIFEYFKDFWGGIFKVHFYKIKFDQEARMISLIRAFSLVFIFHIYLLKATLFKENEKRLNIFLKIFVLFKYIRIFVEQLLN